MILYIAKLAYFTSIPPRFVMTYRTSWWALYEPGNITGRHVIVENWFVTGRNTDET